MASVVLPEMRRQRVLARAQALRMKQVAWTRHDGELRLDSVKISKQ